MCTRDRCHFLHVVIITSTIHPARPLLFRINTPGPYPLVVRTTPAGSVTGESRRLSRRVEGETRKRGCGRRDDLPRTDGKWINCGVDEKVVPNRVRTKKSP